MDGQGLMLAKDVEEDASRGGIGHVPDSMRWRTGVGSKMAV